MMTDSAGAGHGVPPAGQVRDAVAVERAAALVGKLHRVPNRVRQFQETAESARLRYRLRPALLRQLTDSGLPTRRSAGEVYYDAHDLMSCSVHLGSGAMARAARRLWPAALRRSDAAGSVRYEIQYHVRCPSPGHACSCSYVLVTPGGGVVERTVGANDHGPQLRVSTTVNGVWPALPEPAREVLDTTGDLEFMMLPTGVRHSVQFARESRLADCSATTRLLVREARARGLEARPSFGFIVAPPFAVAHYWAELLVNGVWVPVDPVLIRAMIDWGVLTAPEWHPYRSLGGIVSRLTDDGVVLAAHEGRAVPLALPTRLLPALSQSG